MSELLREVLEIPEQAGAEDYVLRLTDSIEPGAIARTVDEYVVVATSTLELGVDVGDLDRVIQVNDPPSVAAFLQRIGRTGRRPGSRRNCLFLTLDTGSLLWAAGLLHLWARGYVEPVVAPPEPRRIVAQQLLALCLQEHRIGSRLWAGAWNGLAPFDRSAEPILRYGGHGDYPRR